MKNKLLNRRTLLVLPVLAFAGLLFSAFRRLPDLFEIRKHQEILSSLFEEANLEYVEEIDPAKLMRTGAEAMLRSLDPYTVYFSESDVTEARMENIGEYGVIGATLESRDGRVVIGTIAEKGSARQAGLLPGDVIEAINGRSAKGRTPGEVEAFLNGQSGSAVRLTVTRDGQRLEMTLSRSEAARSNIAYYGMTGGSTGYIKISQFGPRTAGEFREALLELKKAPAMRNLVIDLRGNPGGILQEAVALCNLFIEKGELIVSTKGKKPENNRSFSTTAEPLDTSLPIAVLLNSTSASASEIVAGALQDLDRAVIIGQRSFGKGLVQASRPLPYNAQLKITIAKYYIPSGRCIQALDYAHRRPDGSVGKIPDSLVSDFKTRNGRLVQDGGGIAPDIPVEPPARPAIVEALMKKRLLFEYATAYRRQHDSIPPAEDFEFDETAYRDFTGFLSGKDYSYSTDSEQLLDKYRQAATEEHYFEMVKDDFQRLKKQLEEAKRKDLQQHRETIMQLLEEEIASRYYFESGRLKASFGEDPGLRKALEVLNDPAGYASLLTGG